MTALRARLEALEAESARPDLWNDRDRAQRVSRDKTAVERELALYDELAAGLDDVEALAELAREETDAETLREAADQCERLGDRLADAELRQLLGGEYDAATAIVSINSGAGGTDAADWAEMLMRMYLRWAERRGFKSEVLDLQPAEEAGVRSATLRIEGDYAYGYLHTEKGVHRLVRISPFDAQARRHTAFASLSVVPEIDDDVDIELDEADCRIDTFRASGAGGQHVNKTESAIRITHLPTGIVVQCQNERSQHKNKAQALKVLRAQLFERRRREQEERVAALAGEKREIGFGSQIRSYTLHPQQRVKDHRTDVEMGNVEAVLDGDLDRFIRATLLWQSAHRAPAGAGAVAGADGGGER